MRLHFIGVGKMGLPMALHLRAGSAGLSVSDQDPVRLALAADIAQPWPDPQRLHRHHATVGKKAQWRHAQEGGARGLKGLRAA